MTTPAELERLDALIKRLTPIGAVATGELIRAADWNLLVEAILELARALYAEGSSNEVPPHTHYDEVTLSWLDKQLRTLVSGGALNDPLQVGKLNSVERKITQLNNDLSLRKEDLSLALKNIDAITTRELARENQVQRLDRQVSGYTSANDEVGLLRLTLDGITNQIGTVQTIADQFTSADGQLVDVANLQSQVSDLLVMREELRDANGEPLTGINIDQKISEALNTLVTEDELLSLLDERLANLDPTNSTDLDSLVASSVDRALSSTLDQFRAEIAKENTALFEQLNASLSQVVADQIPAVSDQLFKDLQGQLSDQLRATEENLLAEISRANQSLRDEMIKADSTLRDEINRDIDLRFEELKLEQNKSITDALARLAKDLESRLVQSGADISANLSNDVDVAVSRRITSNEVLISTDRVTILDDVDTAINAKIDASFKELGLTDDLIGIDDFTALTGIGAVYHNRLQAAKIRSYEDLAALSPEQIGKIINLSTERVIELDVIGQAKAMSDRQV